MKPSYTYTIRPRLPANLGFLRKLANNLWWSWNFDAIDLFRRINRTLWDETSQNPVRMLGMIKQERFEYLSREPGFLSHLERIEAQFVRYLTEPRWFQRTFGHDQQLKVAYYSAEYGLTSCLEIYSGGLGILSGDHLKTASDLGLPLTGVGLAYRLGYFHQYLNIDGWQQERYDENDFYNLPIEPLLREDGSPLTIDVPYAGLGGRSVKAALWRVNVGRVPLILLSTNLPANPLEDREITGQLYGGDSEMRVRQEILLGIGGTMALEALGIRPNVFHMNEGHSAFQPFERIRRMREQEGLDFATAFELAYASGCFTTHTPVPAGNDVFDEALLKKYLAGLSGQLGVEWENFLSLGRDHDVGNPRSFCMTVAALRCAAFANGVSRLHASVSRNMWQPIWDDLPAAEVPIRPVTNAIHLGTWVSHDMSDLLERYLGPEWRDDPQAPELWKRIFEIPDEELWRIHERRRARLVAFARQCLERQLRSRGSSNEEITCASEVLNPEALTIGFARRFATYKRATLLFSDLERLKALVSSKEQPVQFVFAGKAHPRDDEGKKFIREIVHAARDITLRSHIVFLEDYDMTIARYLVQGVDVWLNTPRRPLEASGTSGMKAVANGALHLSTLDGWWDQAYESTLGWAIGGGEEYADPAYQDDVEGAALYELLEREVVPTFYARGTSQLPREWIAMMKRSMANLMPRFSSPRMLRNYIEEGYLPALERLSSLAADGNAQAQELAAWRIKVAHNWAGVKIDHIEVDRTGDLLVGDNISVRATVSAPGLSAGDLQVECYSGTVDSQGNFRDGVATSMKLVETGAAAAPLTFAANLVAPQSGNFGFTVRVFPLHSELPHKYAMYRVSWARAASP